MIPAVLLSLLDRKIKEVSPESTIADHFDLFAGTSTGAILISGLVIPATSKHQRWRYAPEELIKIYKDWGPIIFNNPLAYRLKSGLGLRSAKYPSDGIDQCLNAYFGNKSLSQLGKPVLIPSFDVENKKSVFFTQHKAVRDFNSDFYLWDVIRATTAAPAFFEPPTIYSLGDFKSRKRYTMIDGGIYAQNPALCAYAEAIADPHFQSITSKVKASNMCICSLGTGDTQKSYSPEKIRKWGILQWARPLVSIMMGAAAQTIDYQLRQVFSAVNSENQYTRINPELPDNVSNYMDDSSPENLDNLIEFAYRFAESEEVNHKLNHVIDNIFPEDKTS